MAKTNSFKIKREGFHSVRKPMKIKIGYEDK